MKHQRVIVIILISLFTLTSTTLGPGDKKKKSSKSAVKTAEPSKPELVNDPPQTSQTDSDTTSKKDRPATRQLIRELFDSKADILKNYAKYCKSCATHKEFNRNILGYVTPWHSAGYDVAKQFGHKINMISPVWLQIKRLGRRKYELTGTQDVDAAWMSTVRKNANNTAKILPRILFEKFKMEDLNALFHDEQEIEALSKMLVNKCTELKFDGYVLEIYMQLAGQGKSNINHLVSDIADSLHNSARQLIIVIPPPVANVQQGSKQSKPMFDLDDFEFLKDRVDAFSLMTYDYASHNQIMGLNAPVDWVEQNVEYFFSGEGADSANNALYRSKILLGLNFYGMKYELDAKTERIIKDPEPIIGSRFIDLIKEFRVDIKYDGAGKEHLFIIEDTGRKLIIFYPTLWSIQKRIDLAEKLGTGLSIWELGQGLNYFYDLF